MKNTLLLSLLSIMLVSFSSCSKDGGINIFGVQDDIQLGMKLNQEILSNPQEYPILPESQYPEQYEYVENIVEKLLATEAIVYEDEFVWDVKIIDADVLNAFAAPGGYIYFYTGLIKFLDSEAEFAGVLGHEICHADQRHSTEMLTRVYGVQLLLETILGSESGNGTLAEIALNLAALQYSRGNESQADEYGVTYLHQTQDYDPRGVAGFFQKLIDSGQNSGVPEFLSTHPSPDNRVEEIMNKWQELGSFNGNEYTDNYAAFKASLP